MITSDIGRNRGGDCQGTPRIGIASRINGTLADEVDRDGGKRYNTGDVAGGLEEEAPKTVENLTDCYDPTQVAAVQKHL